MMENDKQLQQLLQKASVQSTDSFEQQVMKRVEKISLEKSDYVPLVNARSRRFFIRLYLGVLFAIVFTCLLITVPVIPFLQQLSLPAFSITVVQKIFTGLLLFWLIYFANFFYQKRLTSR